MVSWVFFLFCLNITLIFPTLLQTQFYSCFFLVLFFVFDLFYFRMKFKRVSCLKISDTSVVVYTLLCKDRRHYAVSVLFCSFSLAYETRLSFYASHTFDFKIQYIFFSITRIAFSVHWSFFFSNLLGNREILRIKIGNKI